MGKLIPGVVTSAGGGGDNEPTLVAIVPAPAKGVTVWYMCSVLLHCPPQYISITGI